MELLPNTSETVPISIIRDICSFQNNWSPFHLDTAYCPEILHLVYMPQKFQILHINVVPTFCSIFFQHFHLVNKCVLILGRSLVKLNTINMYEMNNYLQSVSLY